MAEQKAGGFSTKYRFTAKEQDALTGLHYFGARYYDPAIGIFHGVDAWAEKYPSWSSFVYTMNNPVRYIDPTGNGTESTHIDDQGKVIAVIKDGDNSVYQHGKNADGKSITKYQFEKRYEKHGTSANGTKVGETLTPYSFMGDNGHAVEGAIIDLNDNSGQNFIDKEIVGSNLGLVEYMSNATRGEEYDFKTRGIDERPEGMSRAQFTYRGMKFNEKIASARDIGNYGAGFVAGNNGLDWGTARIGFDALESYQQGSLSSEGRATQSAQRLGHSLGYSRYQAKEFKRNWERATERFPRGPKF